MSVQPWERRTNDLDHVEIYDRIKRLEAALAGSGDDGPWIYVGTIGVDGIDDLLTDDSPPYLNGWTCSDTDPEGDPGPVAFMLTLNGWVHTKGGAVGGDPGTVIFEYPVGYRSPNTQPFLARTEDGAPVDCKAGTDGGLLYEDVAP